MRHQVKYRLAVTETLAAGSQLQLSGNAAHYLTHVLRLGAGDTIGLFNRTDGLFAARITEAGKKSITLLPEIQLQPPERPTGLIACFAPIRGGRLETIIEKATELGADILQPVLTQRSVVDKVNLERAESIAREAAEQCERIGWPEIRPPVKLLQLLGDWPQNIPLLYGDETGGGIPIAEWQWSVRSRDLAASRNASERGGSGSDGGSAPNAALAANPKWAILTGPEGGFAPEELAALKRVEAATALSLGPRILRADTSVITLCAATLMAWGDWHLAPRFQKDHA